jgi:hypothetical protein
MNTETDLKKIFAKIYLKIQLGKKYSNDKFLFLDLVREEIKIIVLTIVTKEFDSLLNKLTGTPYLEETIDLLFKLIILSSKNKILAKLKIPPLNSVQNTNLTKNRVLNLVGFEDYAAFSFVITSLPYTNYKTSNLQILSLKFFLEHLILKISDLLIYYIFVTKKIKLTVLTTYSIDELLLISYSTKAPIYLTWKIYIKSVVPATKDLDVSIKILAFTKTGIIRRTTTIKNPYSNVKLSQVIISRPLKLLEGILFSILHIVAKQ